MNKNLLLLPLLVLLFGPAAKADACDSLEVQYLGFNPFNAGELIVYIHNTNTVTFFNYPGFKLLDANGDTVGVETVNFFGIGEYSAHTLQSTITGYVPGTVFNGTLLLYTGFYDSLECVIPVSSVLAPATGCTEFTVFTTNYFLNSTQVMNWQISDENDSIVFSGVHDYTFSSEIEMVDTVCLENGCYTLTITQSQPLSNVSNAGLQFLSFNLQQNASIPVDSVSSSVSFSVFGCDSTVSINEVNALADGFSVYPNPANSYVRIAFNNEHRTSNYEYRIYNSLGQQVFPPFTRPSSSVPFQTIFDISTFPAGLYYLTLQSEHGSAVKKFVKE